MDDDFTSEYVDNFELDDTILDSYKTPPDNFVFGEEEFQDEFIPEADNRIDFTAEWRDFGDGVNKSRVGIARAVDIEEDLGTMAMTDEKFGKTEQMSRTQEDIFRIIATRTKLRYDINEGVYDDSLRIMQYINRQNRKLRYKNPSAILFALLCISDGEIQKEEIDKIYEKMAKHEKMTKVDLLRYIFFVQDILSNR